MAKTKSLESHELEAILKWIDGYVLSRPSRKLCRDFSDGVLLAEILKSEFPKLVDLHNYPACNGVRGKAQNWDALNRKVLRKLGVQLGREEIEKLARAEATLVEEVLFSVMNRVREAKALELTQARRGGGDSHSAGELVTVTVTRQVGDRVEHIPQQMIPYARYEEALERLEEEQAHVRRLEECVADLQAAADTKAQIIADLEERLEKRRKKSSLNSLRESLASFF